MLVIASEGAAAAVGHTTDHALIDQTSGNTVVKCHTTNRQPFIVYGSFRAINGDVTMRIRFQDSDFVDYPIPQDTSFSFSEAAGDTPGVDGKIVVTTSGGAGSPVGWLSADRANGSSAFVSCTTV
ncbi:MAG: hypothetical protein M3P43_07540 [Actinomycetota bacterium]|nr:hypothetical protein [Actinomycetota bacterium]